MMRRYTYNKYSRIASLLPVIIGMLMMTGCMVHEFPGDDPSMPPPPPPEPETILKVVLTHDTDMPQLTTVYPELGRAADESIYDVRYQINLYPGTNHNRAEDSRALIKSFVFTRPITDCLDEEFDLKVDPENYNILVWVDYVRRGTDYDCFYQTNDFAEIQLATKHIGCEDAREAFRGIREATAVYGQTVTVDIDMVRPMARYCFIATDLHEFVENIETARAQAAGRSVDPGNLSSRSINVDDYHVVFRYTGYMPSAFNMFIDHPSNSRTGVMYEGKMRILSEEELELGFDYVLTNGISTSVNVAVDLYDLQNNLLARSKTINVPLLRSHYTEVRGKFLTTRASGSTSISPDFDGEFNIEIQ